MIDLPAPAPEPAYLAGLNPPYGSGLAQSAIERAADWVAPGGWISVELHGEALILPPASSVATDRRFGKATILLARAVR